MGEFLFNFSVRKKFLTMTQETDAEKQNIKILKYWKI